MENCSRRDEPIRTRHGFASQQFNRSNWRRQCANSPRFEHNNQAFALTPTNAPGRFEAQKFFDRSGKPGSILTIAKKLIAGFLTR